MKIAAIKKIYIKTGIIFAVVIGLIAAAIIFQNKIVESSLSVRGQIDHINKKRVTLDNLRSDLALAKTVKEQVVEYDRYLFPKGQELSLITDLEEIAAKNNITQRITGSNLDSYDGGKIKITLNLYGAYADNLQYISDLENYKYFISVESINFQPAAATKTAGTVSDAQFVTTQLQISLYANS